MGWFAAVWSSLIFRITVLTLAALKLMFACFIMILQTPLLSGALYRPALSENAESIAELVWLIENSPEGIQPFILSAYEGSFRAVIIGDDFDEKLKPRDQLRSRLTSGGHQVVLNLEGRDIRFQSLGILSLKPRLRQEGARPMRVFSALQVAVQLRDGRVLNVWLAPALMLARNPALFVLTVTFILLFSIALGVAISLVTLHPIRRLERDAARLELGDSRAAISETGPTELRRLSAALNQIRERLTGLTREREQMVAAIAHDVRTGLTRIRLRLDKRGEVSAQEIEGDVAQMEALITDMLAYARAENPSRHNELIRLQAFIAKLTEHTPHAIELLIPNGEDFVIAGDPVALRRLFENLFENARRYGGGRIVLRVLSAAGGLEIRIEDDGPGLPEDQLEAVFQPFLRGEASRNRATGGTGLGLGIARAIARAHGAALWLENRPEGGLAAIVHFPAHLRT